MKKSIIIGLFALVSVLAVSNVNAQSKVKKAVDKTGSAIGNTADKVGDKSAEIAKKGANKIGGKTYKGKVAPDGSDVYIDKNDKKYYINKEGKTIYLKASEIKTKKEEKK